MKITTRFLQHEVEASYFLKMCLTFSYDIRKYRKTMKRMGKRKFYIHTFLRFRAHKTIDRFIARVRLINSRSLEFSLQSRFAGTRACRHQAYSQLVTTNFFPLLLLLPFLYSRTCTSRHPNLQSYCSHENENFNDNFS